MCALLHFLLPLRGLPRYLILLLRLLLCLSRRLLLACSLFPLLQFLLVRCGLLLPLRVLL